MRPPHRTDHHGNSSQSKAADAESGRLDSRVRSTCLHFRATVGPWSQAGWALPFWTVISGEVKLVLRTGAQ